METKLAVTNADVRGWWDKKDFGKKAIGSVKTGLAAVLSFLLANLLGLSYPYWAAISAIVVLGWDSTLTFASCRDRIIGTAIGAFMGWVTFYLWHGHYVFYGVSVALCIFVCSGLQFEKAGRLAGATLSLIVLVQTDRSPGSVAIDRFLETGIGVVMALAMSLLPPHAAKTDATTTAQAT
jgi:uncharacterized membrane protein YgaE (UPF0421/DUF939 family)